MPMNLNLTANTNPGMPSGNRENGHGTRLNSSNFRNVISCHELPSGNLGQVLTELQPRLAEFPRSVPGSVRVDGNLWEFADLHGFFHQSIQIFRDRLYAIRGDEPVRRILDCGAHTGLASLFWYHNFREARIDAYEADPTIAGILKKNIEVWNLDRVTAQESAIWTHDRGVNFHSSGDDSGHVSADQTNTLTPSTRLKILLDKEPWDLVKIDIEGAEFDVIRDAAESLHRARHWVVEIHQFPHCRDHARVGELIHYFESAGFQFSFGDFHQATWIKDEFKPPFEALQSQNYVMTLFAWLNP